MLSLSITLKDTISASKRAYALAPADLYVETNRAHALLIILRRLGGARAVYLAHKGTPMSLTDDQLWEDVKADDVLVLTKARIKSPILAHINAKLGGKSSAIEQGST
jgi:hypothetical protein